MSASVPGCAAGGYRVTLAGPDTYQGLAGRHGLGFHCLVSQAAADDFRTSPDLWHPIKSGLHGARWGVRFRHRRERLAGQAHFFPARP
jgi:hypothetical protein